jgi:hypothetical protein
MQARKSVASRAMGFEPVEAAQRAAVAAAMVIECSGAEDAMHLRPDSARSRLEDYVAGRTG